MHSTYRSPNYNWSGRKDSKEEERIFQFIEERDLDKQGLPEDALILLGFRTDTGVERNLGRIGAKEGPDAIRKSLGGLAVHQLKQPIIDAGNFDVIGDDLEATQAHVSDTITRLAQKKNRLLLLGGGHEIAWAHFKGLFDAHPEKQIGIINFDAHFDLREPGPAGCSSGTPFLQAAELAEGLFNYQVIGIQPSANPKTLFKTAKQLDVSYQEATDVTLAKMETCLSKLNTFIQAVDMLYLTICLDAFDISIAPGVSAPCQNGLTLETIAPLFDAIFSSNKLLSADIAELAPQYDEQAKTAKLAAWIALQIIEQGYST